MLQSQEHLLESVVGWDAQADVDSADCIFAVCVCVCGGGGVGEREREREREREEGKQRCC
jgi:hypothetical protein